MNIWTSQTEPPSLEKELAIESWWIFFFDSVALAPTRFFVWQFASLRDPALDSVSLCNPDIKKDDTREGGNHILFACLTHWTILDPGRFASFHPIVSRPGARDRNPSRFQIHQIQGSRMTRQGAREVSLFWNTHP